MSARREDYHLDRDDLAGSSDNWKEALIELSRGRSKERIEVALRYLSQSWNYLDHTSRPIFCSDMISGGFVSMALKYLNRSDYVNWKSWNQKLLKLVFNMSEVSKEVCKCIVEHFYHVCLVKKLKERQIQNLLKVIDDETCSIASSSLGIVLNIIQEFPGSIQHLRENGTEQVVCDLLSCLDLVEDTNIKPRHFGCLIELVVDVDRDQRLTDSQTVVLQSLLAMKKYIRGFKTVKTKDDEKYIALFQQLANLAQNRQICMLMIKSGVIGICETVLKSDQEHQDIRNHAKTILSNLKAHSQNWGQTKSCGVDFEKFQIEIETLKYGTDQKKHVMISYSNSQRAIARQLSEELQDKGIDTWIEIDNLQRSWREGLAAAEKTNWAIDNAYAVICCYSQAYESSKNCKNQLSYAKDLNKKVIFVKVEADYKPQGVVAYLISNIYYYDLSTEKKFRKNLPKLVQRLTNNNLKTAEMENNAIEYLSLNVLSDPITFVFIVLVTITFGCVVYSKIIH